MDPQLARCLRLPTSDLLCLQLAYDQMPIDLQIRRFLCPQQQRQQ